MTIPLISEQEFESQVLRSEIPVLIDLYADWCQPCKQLEPILQEVAREVNGKVKVVRIDVEQSPAIAQAFRVQSIPMMVLMHQGRPVDQLVGLVDKKTILEALERVMPREAGEVSAKDLAALVQAGRALPVDVRDAAAYGRYRIPGAIHVPADELATRLAELQPVDGRVRVLYGRGGDDGKDAARAAGEAGAQVGFLAGGFLDWEAEGLEVERG
jgi:thioredoxin